MRLLLTRPRRDALDFAEHLATLGHEAVISPAMEVACRAAAPPAAKELSGLVVSSRNALFCLDEQNLLQAYLSLPLFAVGEATARAARKLGFRQVLQGAGRAQDLPPLLLGHFAAGHLAARPKLYHPRGLHQSFDLAAALAGADMDLLQEVVYETVATDALAAKAVEQLANGDVDAVVLMSPRSARIFERLVNDRLASKQLQDVLAICISQKVADTLKIFENQQKKVALTPNLDGIFTLIGQINKES